MVTPPPHTHTPPSLVPGGPTDRGSWQAPRGHAWPSIKQVERRRGPGQGHRQSVPCPLADARLGRAPGGLVLELTGPRQHQSGRRCCSSISAEETHGTSIDNRSKRTTTGRCHCLRAEVVFADARLRTTFLFSVGYCGFLSYRKQRWLPHYHLLPSKKIK